MPRARSELACSEGVAGAQAALLAADREPAHPLLGGAVGPRVGVHATGGALLDPVVADGAGSVERLLDVLLVELLDQHLAAGVLRLGGVLGPHAGVAVGLQLEAHS